MAYEVWAREKINGNGNPEGTCYVIDTAINMAKKLARGTIVRQVWRYKPPTISPANPWGAWGQVSGEYVDVLIPKLYAVVEHVDGSNPIVCGWAKDGKYMSLVSCKRCNSFGIDPDDVICIGCHGASYNPF